MLDKQLDYAETNMAAEESPTRLPIVGQNKLICATRLPSRGTFPLESTCHWYQTLTIMAQIWGGL